jgi:hypothetical protein
MWTLAQRVEDLGHLRLGREEPLDLIADLFVRDEFPAFRLAQADPNLFPEPLFVIEQLVNGLLHKFLGISASRRVLMSETATINLEWIVWESDRQRSVDILNGGGNVQSESSWEPDDDKLEVFGDSQLEPLMIITATVTLAWLAREIPRIVADWRRPEGVVIDSRGGKIAISPDPRLKPDTLVIIDDKGSQVYLPENRSGPLQSLIDRFSGK